MNIKSLPPADRLAISDKPTLVLEALPNGNFKVRSNSLGGDKVILAGEVLEVRWFEGRLRMARKDRLPDAGDPPRVPSDYDPYGPGQTDDDLPIEQEPEKVDE